MKLSTLCISRPVLASVMNVALLVFGLIGLNRLPVRELPDIDPPIINVLTVYTGASAEVIETQITEPIEEAIMSVDGIRSITSESREQVSSITVEFNLSRDIDVVAQDVRDRVARVRGRLPDEIEEPIVAKQDADASPVLWVALFSDRYSTLELSQLAENVFKDRLQTINGVSSVILGGEKRFAIRLWLNPEKMAAYGLTVLDVRDALRKENVELPSGLIENRQRSMTIQTRGQMKDPKEFNELVIKKNGDTFIRLKDIGQAMVGVEDERSVARFNSKPAVGIGIIKQSKANTIEVVKNVKATVAALEKDLPKGVITSFPYDESIYVQKSIIEVWETLAIAFLLVVMTIFMFLHNARSTLIPSIAIPVSLISTFGVMYVMGFSINIVTMLGLVLAIGLVVDDAIIVLENIFRHIEEGLSPMQAAIKGMSEIGFVVIATTLALICVFVPFAFQTSVTGRFFIEFAIAISMSVLISAFVALTLTPMMCARVLRKEEVTQKPKGLLSVFEKILNRITDMYRNALDWSLNHGKVIAFIIVICLGLTAFFFKHLDQEFVPTEDKGRFLVFALSPEGSTSEYTDSMIRQMEEIVKKTPETQEYFSAVALARGGPGNPAQGLAFIRLKEDRKRHLRDIVGGPMGLGGQFFMNIQGAFAIPIMPKSFGGGFTQPFELVIQHSDLKTLNAYAQQLTQKLRMSGYLINVRSNFEINKPELDVSIDRDRAAQLGISVEDISKTLQIAFGGLDISKVNLNGKEYDVIAQMPREFRLLPQQLDTIYLKNSDGNQIPLSSVVHYRTTAGPSAINHVNRYRSAVIEATPLNVTLGTAMERTTAILKEDLPPGFRYEWKGEAKELLESSQGIYFVLLLALVVIYLVLAAQFESLVHPLTVMMTIPLAFFGAFGLLWVLNLFKIPSMGVNLYSQIGLILLIGLVIKNGIILVDFANQQMREGKTAREAMKNAGVIRLRPILMTATATIAGILPIAIGFGASGEARRPLGVAAVGGMLTSTWLTLFVIPVVYVALHHWASRMKGEKKIAGWVVIFIAAALSSSGCDLAPRLDRPSVPMPSSYVHGDQGMQAIKIEAIWWKAFEDPVLDDLEERAIKHNQNLVIAMAAVDEARSTARLAKKDLALEVNLSPSFDRERFSGTTTGRNKAVTQNEWSIPFDLDYEVDLWGKLRNALKAKQALAKATEADYRLVYVNLTSDVAQYYFQIRRIDESLRVLEETVALRQKVQEILKSRQDNGLTSALVVAQASTALAQAKALIVEYKRQRLHWENALALLCGENVSQLTVKPSLLPLQPLSSVLYGLPSHLLQNRSDIIRASYQLQAAALEIGVAKAAFFPQLTITANAGLKSAQIEDLFKKASGAWGIMPAMNLPILNGGENESKLSAAEARYKGAVAQYKQTVLNALADAEDALIDVRLSQEDLKAQWDYKEASKKAFDMSLERYQQGLVSYLEVVDSHREYLDAQLSYVQSRYQQYQYSVKLIKAVGGPVVEKK